MASDSIITFTPLSGDGSGGGGPQINYELFTPTVPPNWGQVPTLKSEAINYLVNYSTLVQNVIYVHATSTLANDSNSGVITSPLKTLQAAVNKYLNQTNFTKIVLLSSIPPGDSFVVNTDLSVNPGSSAPNLILDGGEINSLRPIECNFSVFGLKGISLVVNSIQISHQALAPGAPRVSIVATDENRFNISFSECEFSRLEINNEGIEFNNIQLLKMRDVIIRNGIFDGDIKFINIKHLEFHDCLIDPVGATLVPGFVPNTHFIRNNPGRSKILFASAGKPFGTFISDGITPTLGYRQFARNNPNFTITNGGSMYVGLYNDVFFSDIAPHVTFPANLVIEMLNCKILSNLTVDVGANLTTSHCVLNDLEVNGTWTDNDSTNKTITGTGTFNFNSSASIYQERNVVVSSATYTQTKYDTSITFNPSAITTVTLLDLTNFQEGRKFRYYNIGDFPVTLFCVLTNNIENKPSVTLNKYNYAVIEKKNATTWSLETNVYNDYSGFDSVSVPVTTIQTVDSIAIADFQSAKWLVTVTDSVTADRGLKEVRAVYSNTDVFYDVSGGIGLLDFNVSVVATATTYDLIIENISPNTINVSVLRFLTSV